MATEVPLTAAQIYEQVTGGNGIGSLADAHDGAGQLTNRMVERAQRISALRAKTMSGWQGAAGDSAADATIPLVRAAADDAVHLETARTAVGAQMDAFGTAKNSVKPVAPQPPELTSGDLLNVLTGDGQSYNTKVAGWQADSQANIDAFGAYHSASTANGGRMPAQYAQIADSGAPVSMTTPGQETRGKTTTTGRPTTFATDTGEWARNPRQPGVSGQERTSGQDQNVQAGRNQVQPTNQQGNQAVAQTPGGGSFDSTHANNYVPQPVTPPAAQGGYQFGPSGQLVSNLGGGSGYQPYGDFGPGTGGFGPGTGTSTGTGPGNSTSGRYGGPNGGVVTPRGPGSGSGARLPDERLPGQPGSRGIAGARGANGMPMGTAAGGRGAKDEDKEKKTAAYLKNPDPDETFGGFIEKPMPPVIGENRPK
ncbi:hypothetical protein ACGFMK_04355 [Amycolatopsis sp. NPDC049252]|uniref:PPE domain-containing protein n=1 Tax=Amycolatopsis sp. NPDC049252 TaxID=3363933 RepID=UPI003721CACB